MIPAWGNAIADDITRKDVRDWLKALDYSGPTIGKIKGIMHAVYEYGMFEELCSSNPCKDWRLKGVKSVYKAIIVTPQQTLTILKSMTDLLHFTLVFTVAATALRASEVMSLRWSDILWNENRIRVNKRWRKGRDGKPKTAASDSTLHSERCLPCTFAFGEKRAPTQVTATSFFLQGRRTVQSQSARRCSTGATCGKLLSPLA